MRLSPGMAARILSLLAALAVAFAAAAPAAGAPTNAAIQAKQAEAAAAQRELERIDADVEMKVEDYNAATEALERTRADIVTTRGELERAGAELVRSQGRLDERARAIYMGGPQESLTMLVGVTSFEDLVTRLDLLDRITGADADLVDEVSAYRGRVAAAEVALTNREAEQIALRQQAEAARAQVEAVLKRQKAYVAGLNAEVQRLMAEERERQRRIAEELARRAAAEAAARRAAPREASGTPGSPHPRAVDIALRYLGVPYVWGGMSPAGFDCSGLTHHVYAELGVDLPRTSREQFRVGAFIPASKLDALQPGDLVFFGYEGDPDRVHHVGIYAGSGTFVHAPASGDVVKVSSLTERIAARNDYVGAVRP